MYSNVDFKWLLSVKSKLIHIIRTKNPGKRSLAYLGRRFDFFNIGEVCWFYQHTPAVEVGCVDVSDVVFYPKHCFSPFLKTHPIDILPSDLQSARI
jgi:hypothetical protein